MCRIHKTLLKYTTFGIVAMSPSAEPNQDTLVALKALVIDLEAYLKDPTAPSSQTLLAQFKTIDPTITDDWCGSTKNVEDEPKAPASKVIPFVAQPSGQIH